MTSPATPQRRTRQRVAVEEAQASVPEFRTAQEVHELLAQRGTRVGLATVYRTLQALAEAGEADVVRTPDGQVAYRACARTHHHHHLICRRCGHAVEAEFEGLEAVLDDFGRRHGFTAVDHDLELFGLCPACSAGAEQSASDEG